MKKNKRFFSNIRGEVVPFLFIMPIWLFFLAFLGLQYTRISDMNAGENAARNAIRVAVKQDNYTDAFNRVSSSLEDAGFPLDGEPNEFLNIYIYSESDGWELAPSNTSPDAWRTGNVLELAFRTPNFFNREVNQICFMGNNCVDFFRDSSPIIIRALIE